MAEGQFLVARITVDEAKAPGPASWTASARTPYRAIDPLDFPIAERDRVFELYRRSYARDAPKVAGAPQFNIDSPDGLFEYNRFILITDDTGTIVAFVLAKDRAAGVKICVTGTDGSKGARSAVVALHVAALNATGVYAEVSGRMEAVLSSQVPSVPASRATDVLEGKTLVPHYDGIHYTREITNLGQQTKRLVGKPRGPRKRSRL
ncbi:MAG: hypothetical protein ACRENE_10025 [Polyangiaceae bacterium]